MVTKATYVGPAFTRKPPKYERFIRPSGLRFTKAHITHPELKCTFCLEIIGVKKNPNGTMYTSLGVLTRGTIIEVSPKFVFGSHLMLKLQISFGILIYVVYDLSRSIVVSFVLLHLVEKLSGVSNETSQNL